MGIRCLSLEPHRLHLCHRLSHGSLFASRQGLGISLDGVFCGLPGCLRQLCAIALHIAASSFLSPLISAELSLAVREAQIRGRFLLPLAVGRLWSSFVAGAMFLADDLLSSEPRKTCATRAAKSAKLMWWEGADDDDLPPELLCPITGSVFVHPVAVHGMLFEEAAGGGIDSTPRMPRPQRCWIGGLPWQRVHDPWVGWLSGGRLAEVARGGGHLGFYRARP